MHSPYPDTLDLDSPASFAMDPSYDPLYGMAGPCAPALPFYFADRNLSVDSQTCSPGDVFPGGTLNSTPFTEWTESPLSARWSHEPSPAWTEDQYHDNIEPLQFFGPLPGDPLPGDEIIKEVPTVESAVKKPAAPTRKGSSPNKSPGKSPRSSRPSLTSGITKKKQSNRPLPDIIIDPNDPKDVKRGRNTLAARGSRARKEERVLALIAECNLWKARAFEAGYREPEEEQQLDDDC
ncbi:MAG: hypothetical protein Q9220_003452 [cf. Caloplaca sp. 1 TL-2023]